MSIIKHLINLFFGKHETMQQDILEKDKEPIRLSGIRRLYCSIIYEKITAHCKYAVESRISSITSRDESFFGPVKIHFTETCNYMVPRLRRPLYSCFEVTNDFIKRKINSFENAKS